VEILVGESVYFIFGVGAAFHTSFLARHPCLQQFLDKSSAQHEIRYFFIDHYSAVSNNIFQPTVRYF